MVAADEHRCGGLSQKNKYISGQVYVRAVLRPFFSDAAQRFAAHTEVRGKLRQRDAL